MRKLQFFILTSLFFPLWGLGGHCQAQVPDTLITVTKLPYPKARISPLYQSPGGAPSLARGGGQDRRSGRNPSSSSPSRNPSPSLPPQDYDSCIHHRHTRLLAANLTTLKQSKKGAWLKYLPSLSLSSGLTPFTNNGDSSPFGGGGGLTLGLNSNLIYTAHRDKQKRAATREAIIKRSQLQEDLEIAKLHRLQQRLQVATDKLNLQSGVADIDRQLFNLYQQQYDNHDITPEEYLLKRKAFLLQELRNQDQITRIEALQFEIEDLAGCLTSPLKFHSRIPPLGARGPTRK